MPTNPIKSGLCFCTAVLLLSCTQIGQKGVVTQGGGGDFSVSAVVTGLAGPLTVNANGTDQVLTENGTFTLIEDLADQGIVQLSLTVHPSGLGCRFTGGLVSFDSVIDNTSISYDIHCETAFELSGTASENFTGTIHKDIVAINHITGEILEIPSESSDIAFAIEPVNGEMYDIEVIDFGGYSNCVVQRSSAGTISNADVTDVLIICVP